MSQIDAARGDVFLVGTEEDDQVLGDSRMRSSDLLDLLAGIGALACAVTVFVASVLDVQDDARAVLESPAATLPTAAVTIFSPSNSVATTLSTAVPATTRSSAMSGGVAP